MQRLSVTSKLQANESEITKPEQISILKQEYNDENILFFENEIPPFIEAEMDKLYGTPYSCVKKFKIYESLDNVSTYIALRNNKVTSIFLFRVINSKIKVMNEFFKVSQEELQVFSKAAFSRFRAVSAISFSFVETDVKKLSFPYQRFNCSENLVVSLPASPEEYMARLGSATRRNIKYYSNKLKRDFPSFSYQFYEKEEVTEQHIREIVKLKLARFSEKKKTSGTKLNEVDRILALVKACNGLVGVATIGGRVCAGQISYRLDKNDVAVIIAHDPQYKAYSLGNIFCYLTICECITRGGQEFHFLWGREEYKYRFLGKQRDLDRVNIYRSSMHLCFNSRLALSTVFKAYVHAAKFWILHPKRRDHLLNRLAIGLFRYLRKFSHIKS